MARKKKTAEESVSALNAAISQLASEAAAGTRQYLGEDGLKRLISLIGESLKGKQDTLAQGDNITIEDGVISSKDTGATSVEASGESPLTLTASYDADTRKMTVGGSVDLEDYALTTDLQRYLPLTGGTLTGDLTAKNIEMEELIAHSVYLDDTGSMLRNKGQTTLALTENADAPDLVAADGDGRLYRTPAENFATGDDLKGKMDAFEVGEGLELTDGTLNCTVDPTLFVVVQELPDSPYEGMEYKIYLIPAGKSEEGNVYAEYLWVNSAWEKLGELTATVDLSGYLPLTGGTLTGGLTVNGGLAVNGDTVLEMDDEGTDRYLVTTDRDGILHRADANSLHDGRYLRLTGGTLSGDLTVEGSTYITTPQLKPELTVKSNLLTSDDAGSAVQRTSVSDLISLIDIPDVPAVTGEGVYVAYTDSAGVNRAVEPDKWDGSGTVNGVLIVENGHSLLVCGDEVSGYGWAGSGQVTTGLDYIPNNAMAQNDFDGKWNNRVAWDNGNTTNGYSFGYAKIHTYGNVGAGRWWVPSLGELKMMKRHLDDVQAALSKIGATQLTTQYSDSARYVSSTQCSATEMWAFSMSEEADATTVDNGVYNYRVRCVGGYVWTEK